MSRLSKIIHPGQSALLLFTRRLRKISIKISLLITILVFLIGAAVWLAPKGLALYFQVKGGQFIQQAINNTYQGSSDWIPCLLEPVSDQTARVQLEQAIAHLRTSISYNPNLAQSYLLLGRAACYLGESDSAVADLQIYTNLRPGNPLGHLELGIALDKLCKNSSDEYTEELESDTQHNASRDIGCDNSRSLQELRASGVTAAEMVTLGDYFYNLSQFIDALQSYERAILIAPDYEIAWNKIGATCSIHQGFNLFNICSQFLDHNGNNWFINPEFTDPNLLDTWETYEYTGETKYRVEECPGSEGKKCGAVLIDGDSPPNGAGLYQCIQLQPGTTYKYSVWLKLNTSPEGVWRALYYQGNIEGKVFGVSYENEYFKGSTDWQYFESTFSAPVLDNQTACFHPVRLQSAGQAWLYNPRLEQLQTE